jgi:hypothetical protein
MSCLCGISELIEPRITVSAFQPALLASIQDCIHLSHVCLVIDYATIHLDPGMRLEWQLLRPDYHLGKYSTVPKKAARRCRALQTKRFFPVPDTRHVDCRTDAFRCIRRRRRLSHRVVANLIVERREVTSRQVEIELNQLQVRFQNKKRHRAHLSHTTRLQSVAKNLSSSSGRNVRLVLFDEVTFLQGVKEFTYIVLCKVVTHAKLPADLIDDC